MPPLVSLLFRVLVFLGLGLLAAFSLPDNGHSYALVWPWHLYAQVLWLLPWMALAVYTLAGGAWPRFGGVADLALAAFVALQIAAAFASPFRHASLAALPIAIAPVGFACALRLFPAAVDAATTPAVLRALAIGLFVLNAVALLWWGVLDLLPALLRGLSPGRAVAIRNLHPLGHWNYTSAAGLIGCAVAWSWLRHGSVRARLFGVTAALTGFLAALSGASRGALLGFAALAVVWVLSEARRLRWTWPRIALVLLGFALLLGGAAALHPRSRELVTQLTSARTISPGDRQRLAMLEAAGQMVRDRPLFGYGPGSVPRAYPRYRAQLSGGVESSLQLHSTPAQIAAEAGLPALAAALLAVFTLWWRAVRRASSDATSATAAGTLTAIAVLALTDHPWDVAVLAVSAGAALALAGGEVEARAAPLAPTLSPAHTRLAGAGLLAALVGFVVSQAGNWSARADYSAGVEELYAKNPAAYLSAVEAARTAAPAEPFYPTVHGLLLLAPELYQVPVAPGSAAERFTHGRAALEHALELDPNHETAHFNLGWALLGRDTPAAEPHFLAAAQLVPDKGGVYLGIALCAAAENNRNRATAALALEFASDPAFVTSPWCASETLRPLAGAARAQAAVELERIAADAPAGDPLGFAQQSRYAAALFRWLDGDRTGYETALQLATPSQRETLRWLEGAAPDPALAHDRLLVLAAACAARDAGSPNAPLRRFYAAERPPPPEETLRELETFLAANERRALLLPAKFVPQLVFQTHRQRSAYGLLMKNLDAPTPRDLYRVQENRVVHDFLQPLFPEKGYLPGPVLAGLQRRLPR